MAKRDLDRDGLVVFRNTCSEANVDVPALIAGCCLWVSPDTFRSLPVWYPEASRGAPICDATWTRQYTNTQKSTGTTTQKTEPNIRAGWALWQALGYAHRSNPPNWTVCHLWGIDDPKFQQTNNIVRNGRYYTCVANMVALPSPLKALTDSDPEIKRILRVCAYRLYGWVCDDPAVREQADEIRSGFILLTYPRGWPRKDGDPPPPGVIAYSPDIQRLIDTRKSEIRRDLNGAGPLYPRDTVREVLSYWKIDLGSTP